MVENFNEMTLDELLEVRNELNESIKVARKEAKAAEKEAREAEKERLDAEGKEAMAELTEGEVIRFELKGEETEAPFVKTTEKRFIVNVEDRKIALPFRKYLGVAEEESVAV